MKKVMKNQTKWQLATLFFLLVFGLSAQAPALLKDINVALSTSSPRNMTTVGNIVYFSADDPIHGQELWKTDGTVAGTVLVKDIRTGSSASNPSNLCNVNGTLFFAANDGFRGIELWKSDGTPDGTVLVKDINPNAADSAPRGMFVVGNNLYFVANNGTNGFELWRSNVLDLSTQLVKDINPGLPSSDPIGFVLNDGFLFFSAQVTTNGGTDRELWKSNGFTAGTQLVKNINPNGSSSPSEIVQFDGKVFFAADVTTNGVTDRELWTSDGDAATTFLVKNINALASSLPSNLTVFNGALFFVASSPNLGRELYKSNGTPAGTTNEPTFDIVAGASSSVPRSLTVANNTLFFTAFTTAAGRELWKLTTANVASMVKNINPGEASSTPQALIAVGTTLFFTATTGTHGRELWKSDGSELGTKIIQDIVVGLTGSNISETDMAVRGSDLFFASNGPGGFELRRSNGISVVTVRDLGQGNSNPADFVKMGDFTYFSADNGINGRELWRTDGTVGGTSMVKDLSEGPIGSNPTELTVVTNGNTSTLFFVAGDTRRIFKSNGTLDPAGTVSVQTFFVGVVGQNPTNLTAFQGRLFFTATNSFANGAPDEKRLFRTDGVINVVDPVGGLSLDPQNLTPVGNNLFFTATNNNTDRELWKITSNGTAQQVKNINANGSSNPTELLGIGNTLFFTANNGVNGIQVWKSDGVVNGLGTKQILGAANAFELTNFNGRLVVLTQAPNIPGMKNLLRLNVGLTGFETLTQSFLQILQAAGTNLFLFGGHAGPLYLSKMNTQGQIIDLGELPDQNGNGFEIISAGAKIFFTYPMTDFGREMYTSDGTPLGTGLVLNIWPGAGSANVTEMAVCGPDLFFSANNITNGQEPWKLANVILFDGGGSDERDSNASMDEQPSVLPLRIAPEINVYPNPATDFIRIDLIDNESVSGNLSLMDASGRSLREAQAQAGETNIQLEISDLPKGVYIVRWVVSDGQAVTKKVVVQ